MKQNATEDTLERDGFSVSEIASRYGVSEGLVRLEIARGRLRVVRLGRRVVIPKRALERWLDQGSWNADS
jgi:excisionase family DNA binding protein